MGRRTSVRLALAIVIVGGAVAFAATPAGASPVTGCVGKASSFDGKGRALDKVTAPGAGGTSDDPFHVDVNGTIDWSGSSTQVLQNGRYSVTVAGFDLASGPLKNDEGKKGTSGHENVGKRLDSIPILGWITDNVEPNATLKVKYTVTGDRGGSCRGSVIMKIGDDPLFTPLWLVAVAMFLLAFWLLFWPRGFLGG